MCIRDSLLGDFIAGADLINLSDEIKLGLENHKLVDRFTDSHPSLLPLKSIISKDRRRFLGIISDVVFDYFLIKHWQSFSEHDLDNFVQDVYQKVESVIPLMHERMARAMRFMLDENGLLVNQNLEGVGKTLNRLSQRIRFENKLMGAIEEVEAHYDAFESAFLTLFPALIEAVETSRIEKDD